MLPASEVCTSMVELRCPLMPAPGFPGQGTWDVSLQVAISQVKYNLVQWFTVFLQHAIFFEVSSIT